MDELRRSLEQLADALANLGSANDADDHGYGQSASELRESSHATLKRVIGSASAELRALVPELVQAVEAGKDLDAFGWSRGQDEVLAALGRIKGGS